MLCSLHPVTIALFVRLYNLDFWSFLWLLGSWFLDGYSWCSYLIICTQLQLPCLLGSTIWILKLFMVVSFLVSRWVFLVFLFDDGFWVLVYEVRLGVLVVYEVSGTFLRARVWWLRWVVVWVWSWRLGLVSGVDYEKLEKRIEIDFEE